jgi:hypothetical protein
MKMNKAGKHLLKLVVAFVILYLLYRFYESFNIREGFFNHLEGSSLDYHIGDGVASSWENKDGSKYMRQSLEDNTGGNIPLPEGELLIFKENKFDPECCPSVYSNSSGCVCATPEQMTYLNKRAGNRNMGGDF